MATKTKPAVEEVVAETAIGQEVAEIADTEKA